jgi:hypothetical protein
MKTKLEGDGAFKKSKKNKKSQFRWPGVTKKTHGLQ